MNFVHTVIKNENLSELFWRVKTGMSGIEAEVQWEMIALVYFSTYGKLFADISLKYLSSGYSTP